MEKPTFKSKEEFIAWFQNKTKQFAIDVIKFCRTFPNDQAARVISYQIIKSATSVAANYRAACRGRSQAEFFSKICIVVEEADESVFWLEMIEGAQFKIDVDELKRLKHESDELLAISSKAKGTSGGKSS
ncbi:MAG: four helix bundle protein [Saprospiraceae bacterium]|nr:four helix bundle protein [Saprospiraceae bacterium]MCF8251245.1 four helix bundle protein [Saprospiraceae bacterium]MCF8282988.1 four helix bundle protein [Bacteroidales bacterium]MCF8313131.1 four helix bundle protein [Saprospiraceae bacterium]MCF8441607.1 four helix bundle protein [Saprospiraceae bacterium]